MSKGRQKKMTKKQRVNSSILHPIKNVKNKLKAKSSKTSRRARKRSHKKYRKRAPKRSRRSPKRITKAPKRSRRSRKRITKAPKRSRRSRKRITKARKRSPKNSGRARKRYRKRSPKRITKARKRSPKKSSRARKRYRKRSPKKSSRARKRSRKRSPNTLTKQTEKVKRVSAKAVINGLTWTGNSCYIDSLFVALLASPNTFIDKNILNKRLREGVYENFSCNNDLEKDLQIRQQIQDELRKLTANIRGQSGDNVITCTNFRKIIRACKTSNKNLRFYGTGEQDPVEFLEYICNIFGIRFTATFNEDPIGYLAITYPDFRAFTFDRRIHRNTTWTPPKTTRTGSNVLQLSSVITYTPGHYTCFFRLGAMWYFYNDMSDPFIRIVGNYNDLLDRRIERRKINVQTHGVLYFYTL